MAFPSSRSMYEHAYHIEFGANATAYVAAFMWNIAWAAVQARYNDAINVSPPLRLEQPEFAEVPAVTPEEVQELVDSGQRVQIIDTRPRHYSTRAHDIVAGAVWRDPERVEEWIGPWSPPSRSGAGGTLEPERRGGELLDASLRGRLPVRHRPLLRESPVRDVGDTMTP